MSSSLSTWNQCLVCYLYLGGASMCPRSYILLFEPLNLIPPIKKRCVLIVCEPETEWGDTHTAFEAHPGAPLTSFFIILVWIIWFYASCLFLFASSSSSAHRNDMQCLFDRSQRLNTRAWPLQLWDHNSSGCLHWACALLGPVVISQGSRRAQGAYSSLVKYWPLRDAMGGITAFRWWMACTYGYTGSSVKLVKHKTNKQTN